MRVIDRKNYAQTYGPTTGDRVRLADTQLFIEVEKDLTTYGDEVKFGGGKVIRDGMGQSQQRTLGIPYACGNQIMNRRPFQNSDCCYCNFNRNKVRLNYR